MSTDTTMDGSQQRRGDNSDSYSNSDAGLDRAKSIAIPPYRQLAQIEHTIEGLLAKREVLRREHKERVGRVSIMIDAEFELWNHLHLCKGKDATLLALQSQVVPQCMKPGGIYHYSNLDRICTLRQWTSDKDILMARMQMTGFEEAFSDTPLEVHSSLRNDKEFMITLCAKNSHALQNAGKGLKNDIDVVTAAITGRLNKAPLAIQFASAQVRNNKKVMRLALNHPHGIRAIPHLPEKLKQDRRLVLSSIKNSCVDANLDFEVLEHLPDKLRGDEGIVTAAILKNGKNIRWASDELRNDFELALLACKTAGSAYELLPEGAFRQDLLEQEDDLWAVLESGAGNALKDAPKESQADVDLLLLAVQNGLDDLKALSINLEDLFKSNPSLMYKLTKTNGDLCRCLPRSIIDHHGTDLLLNCLNADSLSRKGAQFIAAKISELNAEFWDHNGPHTAMAIMISLAKSDALDVMHGRVPEDIRNNKEIMMKACEMNHKCLTCVAGKLSMDTDVFEVAVKSCGLLGLEPGSTPYPKEIFAEFLDNDPRLVKAAIEYFKCDADDKRPIRKLYSRFPPQTFFVREVFLAWLKKWGVSGSSIWFVDVSFLLQSGHAADREVVLSLLADVISFSARGGLHVFGNFFKDAEFMKDVVKVDGRALAWSKTLKYDYDLLLLAVATDSRTLQAYPQKEKGFLKIAEFAEEVRSRLESADTFLTEFLRGVAIPDYRRLAPAVRCHLPLLDRGTDIKRLIAQFVGIPTGEDLVLLRSAAECLGTWGY